MSRSTQNPTPFENRRNRQETGGYPARRNNRNGFQPFFPPNLPAGFPPVSPAHRQNPGEVHDPWWLFRERVTSPPLGITNFPAPRYTPDQIIFLDNNATRNTNPTQGRPWSDASPSFQRQLNMPAPAEDSKLTQDEQKQALNKLKKEIYYPMQKRVAKRPNLYYREYAINNFRQTEKVDDEDGKRCAICLEDFEPKEVVSVTPCKHMFHEDCIVPWVKSQGQCPVCRFAICERLGQNAESSTNTTADDQFEIDLISVIRTMEEAFISENMRLLL